MSLFFTIPIYVCNLSNFSTVTDLLITSVLLQANQTRENQPFVHTTDFFALAK